MTIMIARLTLALVLGLNAAIMGAQAVTIKGAPSVQSHASLLSVVEQDAQAAASTVERDAQAAAAAEGAFLYDYGATLAADTGLNRLTNAAEEYSEQSPALTTLRDAWVVFVQNEEKAALEPHKEFSLYKEGEWKQWLFFTFLFFALLIFDNAYLMKNKRVLTTKEAGMYWLMWIGIAGCFNLYVLYMRGWADAANWFNGYVLEWMLSMDNLFVFAMVFDMYGCPDKLKHKPLFWGIVGAVVFRMLFFVIGEALMHTLHFMHIVFGAFLVYTGIKTVAVDDEDDDPTQNPLVVFLATRLPLVNGYDDAGNFFVRVEIDKWGVPKLPAENSEFTPNTKMKDHPVPVFKSSDWYHTPRFVDETGKEIGSGKQTQEQAGTGNTFGELHLWAIKESKREGNGSGGKAGVGGAPGSASESEAESRPNTANASPVPPIAHFGGKKEILDRMMEGKKLYEWRFTMLFVVVLCLEITDVVFAVDSVSAIVAQIPDLFLAYTACIFAMLGLRATFFLVDDLIRMFSLLKYGIAFILVFIGVKLIISKTIHIHPQFVVFVLVGTLFVCMAASIWVDKVKKEIRDEILREQEEEFRKTGMRHPALPGQGFSSVLQGTPAKKLEQQPLLPPEMNRTPQ